MKRLEEARSQILTRLSSPAEAKCLPSGEKAKDKILPRCPLNTRTYEIKKREWYIIIFRNELGILIYFARTMFASECDHNRMVLSDPPVAM